MSLSCRWYANETPLSTRDAAHLAAVEIGLKQMVKAKLTNSIVKDRDPAILAQIKSCKIDGLANNWGDRIRFPDSTTMENLLRNTFSENMPERNFEKFYTALKRDGKLENRLYDANTTEPIRESLRSLPLTDGNVKLAVRVSFGSILSRYIMLTSNLSSSLTFPT